MALTTSSRCPTSSVFAAREARLRDRDGLFGRGVDVERARGRLCVSTVVTESLDRTHAALEALLDLERRRGHVLGFPFLVRALDELHVQR